MGVGWGDASGRSWLMKGVSPSVLVMFWSHIARPQKLQGLPSDMGPQSRVTSSSVHALLGRIFLCHGHFFFLAPFFSLYFLNKVPTRTQKPSKSAMPTSHVFGAFCCCFIFPLHGPLSYTTLKCSTMFDIASLNIT